MTTVLVAASGGMLASLEQLETALSKVDTIEAAKAVIDRAVVLEVMAAKVGGEEALLYAQKVKAISMRRCGELIAKLPKAAPKVRAPDHREAVSKSAALKAAGIPKQRAAEHEKIASIPKEAFDKHVAAAANGEASLTTAALLRVAAVSRLRAGRKTVSRKLAEKIERIDDTGKILAMVGDDVMRELQKTKPDLSEDEIAKRAKSLSATAKWLRRLSAALRYGAGGEP